MRECETCGNEIGGGVMVCPFCETPQRGEGSPVRTVTSSGRIVTVNLEEGLPSVEQALSRLDTALLRARGSGGHLLRLIHGYGSSGVGGRLREAIRIQLNYLRRSGRIRLVVPGEEYGPRSAETRRLMKRYPALARSERTDGKNPGITFVEI
ncbi:MAG: Smr/MutS family protein [Kiritimatiellae bacterium]|nr:Smr/MutS family protein [Kiritimatiellia bacterium]MDD4735661.1 Smr/MutS family protein [Kiritimatiellia bacterium]